MRLSSSQVEKRLSSEKNTALALATRLRQVTVVNGRAITHQGGNHGEDNVYLSPLMQELVALYSIEIKPRFLYKDVGVSKRRVESLSYGVRDPRKGPDPDLVAKIKARKSDLSENALDLAMRAFGHVSEDKLEASEAKELVAIAKDAATIFEKMNPEGLEGKNSLTLHVHVPERKKTEDYNVIDIN